MSEYEDLVELGFEGVDKFATKYHDVFADKVGSLKHKRKNKFKQGAKGPNGPEGERKMDGDAAFTGPQPPSHRYERNEPLPPPEEHLGNSQLPMPGFGQTADRQRQYPPFVPTAQGRPEPLAPDRGPPPSIGAQVPHYYYPRNLDPYAQSFAPFPKQRAMSDPGDYSSDSDSTQDLEEGNRDTYEPYSTSNRRADRRSNRVRRDRTAGDVYASNLEEKSMYGYRPDERQAFRRDQNASRKLENGEDRMQIYRRNGDFEKRVVEEREYYSSTPDRWANGTRTGAMMSRRPETDDFEAAHGRRRPRPARRGSSWSPPRRRLDEDQGSSRHGHGPRARSPNSYRTIGTIVGALAGGLAGSQVKKSEGVPNTMAAVAGAVVGGLGAREAEKAIDRRREQRRVEDRWGAEREERRARRRSSREGYERRWE
ncbi:unnamed protein product [Periconia digitata]|uniref:Glycine zipper 2TM domain-containing protein n=1 Tax=Periconia digitata TaxID=1303443 RepID=A0A9W4UIB6_9PLEO|nr:unnamed protein product [Periconia digitata]